jgi:hypothetical protein
MRDGAVWQHQVGLLASLLELRAFYICLAQSMKRMDAIFLLDDEVRI